MAYVFARNQDFAIRRELKPKKKVQMCKLGDVLSTLVYLKPNADGGLEAKPLAAVQFFVKTNYFNATGSQFTCVQNLWKN